jgi:GTP cyclohydrolase I
MNDEVIEKIAAHVREIIGLLGENPDRQGLQKTPLRYAKALVKATEGYRQDADTLVNGAIFEVESHGMVLVKDIEFLPFFGKISIAYMPSEKMIGLSKLARIVDLYARRLQVQERLTVEVLREVERVTQARGVMVVCEAGHLCMKMRGVEKQNASSVTIETSGCFETDSLLRSQVLESLKF